MQSRKYRGRVPSNWRVGVDEILLCDPQTCAALWFLSFSLTYFFPSFSISSLSLSFVWLSRCFLYDSVRLVHLSFGFSCDGDARRETRKGRARVVNRQGNHRFASYSFICELLTRTPRPLAQSLQQQQLRSIYQTRQYCIDCSFTFVLNCRLKNVEKTSRKRRKKYGQHSVACHWPRNKRIKTQTWQIDIVIRMKSTSRYVTDSSTSTLVGRNNKIKRLLLMSTMST